MSEERVARVREILDRVLAVDADERETHLDEACGGDRELREEVASLLRARESMGDFLERPALANLGAVWPERSAFDTGDRVASYEIVREVGTGGTGTVFEALQESPRRMVALKVMRGDLPSEAAEWRFRNEAEILARLRHPAVAHVYEAGVHTASGATLPWFAMEFVAGARTVVGYAEEERLGLAERIRLVVAMDDPGARVDALAFDPGGRYIARASPGVVDVLDARTLARIARLEGEPRWVSELSFSPSRDRLFGGCVDGSIRIWDLRTRRQVAVLRRHGRPFYSLAISPDGRCIATGEGLSEVPGVIRLWETGR